MINNNKECDQAARAHQIRVVNASKGFVSREDTNLLVSMERANQSHVLVGCRGGGCGKCRIQVLEGDYQSKKMSRAHIHPGEPEQGIVLACRIFARSDLTIQPLAAEH
ncbi:2Fe-2S iron-sulfur cluster-binding protein [Parathalassolituus penaei]|uniref:2Fe-2S iron-sulfur cluster-binding protein n=1 Tax=Parathalassolituus penaei TaxID=2997323 RepID=A0A9X3IT22_9GAMM|nr:2Fe-2S iron-sulfur cluster-binding protein [Parathalassolituus penaei]MCY0964748.1 2Fe-2S iron-sulfur cluster-binding protein [Parathalassolituus penaei]